MATTQARLSLRKDDQVQVIAGKDKGKTGKIISVDAANFRVTVEKVNLVKRHMKPNQKNPQGGIVEKELPIHYSNVQLWCSKCNRGTRFGIKMQAAGKKGTQKKTRVCKRCESSMDAA